MLMLRTAPTAPSDTEYRAGPNEYEAVRTAIGMGESTYNTGFHSSGDLARPRATSGAPNCDGP